MIPYVAAIDARVANEKEATLRPNKKQTGPAYLLTYYSII